MNKVYPDARSALRRLQPYFVSVYSGAAERYRKQGLIAPVTDGVGEWMGAYDEVRGLVAEAPALETLVL